MDNLSSDQSWFRQTKHIALNSNNQLVKGNLDLLLHHHICHVTHSTLFQIKVSHFPPILETPFANPAK